MPRRRSPSIKKTDDPPVSKANAGKRRFRVPLVKKTDSWAKIRMGGLFAFFLQGMVLFLFGGFVWLVPSIILPFLLPNANAFPSYPLRILGVVCFIVLIFAGHKYVVEPISRKIEDLIGVKGADNLDNPNINLIRPACADRPPLLVGGKRAEKVNGIFMKTLTRQGLIKFIRSCSIAFLLSWVVVLCMTLYYMHPSQQRTATLPDIAGFNQRSDVYEIPPFGTDGDLLCFEEVHSHSRHACLLGKFDDELDLFRYLPADFQLQSIENGLPFDTPGACRPASGLLIEAAPRMGKTRILDEIQSAFHLDDKHRIELDDNVYYFTFRKRNVRYDMIIHRKSRIFLISVHATENGLNPAGNH